MKMLYLFIYLCMFDDSDLLCRNCIAYQIRTIC